MLNRSTRITARPARTAQRECTSVISLPRVWRIITDSRLPESRDRVRVSPESVACQPPTMIAHPPPVSLWPRAPSPRTMTSKLYLQHMSFPFYIFFIRPNFISSHQFSTLLSTCPSSTVSSLTRLVGALPTFYCLHVRVRRGSQAERPKCLRGSHCRDASPRDPQDLSLAPSRSSFRVPHHPLPPSRSSTPDPLTNSCKGLLRNWSMNARESSTRPFRPVSHSTRSAFSRSSRTVTWKPALSMVF